MQWLKVFLISLFVTVSVTGSAQSYYRIRADVTVKKKNFDGTFSLTKGTVYYDKNYNLLVYDLWFPEKETVVLTKEMTYHIKDGKLHQAFQTVTPPDASIFALILKNAIRYYGLENSGYKLSNVEEDEGLIISTWEPPAQLKSATGKILIANKDGRIKGIVFFSIDGEKVVSKQFFENYQNTGGVDFPTKMVQFFYDLKGNESVQTTEFKNIKIDEQGNENFYHFPVGKYLGK